MNELGVLTPRRRRRLAIAGSAAAACFTVLGATGITVHADNGGDDDSGGNRHVSADERNREAQDDDRGGGHGAQVNYRGPVRYDYSGPCAARGAGWVTTYLKYDGSQYGCQHTYNGGSETGYTNGDRKGQDSGTWDYKAPNGTTYTGTYKYKFTVHNNLLMGTEDFVDPHVGTIHQDFSYDYTTRSWDVTVRATGPFSGFSGSTDSEPDHDGRV